MTLNGVITVILSYFTELGGFWADYVKVVEDGVAKNWHHLFYTLTLPNINRF